MEGGEIQAAIDPHLLIAILTLLLALVIALGVAMHELIPADPPERR